MTQDQARSFLGFIDVPAPRLSRFLEIPESDIHNWRAGRKKVSNKYSDVIWDLAKKKADTIGVKIDKI